MLHTLRKILLSTALVGLFALYAFQQRQQTGITSPAGVAVLVPTQPSSPPVLAPGSTSITSRPSAGEDDEDNREGHAGSENDGDDDDSEWSAAQSTTTTANRATTTLPTVIPTTAAGASTTQAPGSGRDGVYLGATANAYWGDVQVQVTIANGQITDVQFVTYPDHRSRSVSINTRAMPILVQEAIAAQSAQVDIVSGATDTSEAFIHSLSTALAEAAA